MGVVHYVHTIENNIMYTPKPQIKTEYKTTYQKADVSKEHFFFLLFCCVPAFCISNSFLNLVVASGEFSSSRIFLRDRNPRIWYLCILSPNSLHTFSIGLKSGHCTRCCKVWSYREVAMDGQYEPCALGHWLVESKCHGLHLTYLCFAKDRYSNALFYLHFYKVSHTARSYIWYFDTHTVWGLMISRTQLWISCTLKSWHCNE